VADEATKPIYEKDAKDGQEYTEAKMTGFPEAETGGH